MITFPLWILKILKLLNNSNSKTKRKVLSLKNDGFNVDILN